ncbi:hypothetical protein N657DRAFT_136473 [Parathielavia appendiculata]|uniref:Uncharacterized protein n=1 Tax=Parathielavia appendiculata TaxID=2587402 RepID=A0AAN6Z0P3_9PEZI|nr:hypothetical protein N657DRAFT_136473 [Parathielavia appendiculata]
MDSSPPHRASPVQLPSPLQQLPIGLKHMSNDDSETGPKQRPQLRYHDMEHQLERTGQICKSDPQRHVPFRAVLSPVGNSYCKNMKSTAREGTSYTQISPVHTPRAWLRFRPANLPPSSPKPIPSPI